MSARSVSNAQLDARFKRLRAQIGLAPTALSGIAILVVRFPIVAQATTSSATSIPVNSVIVDARLDVTTPFSVGATISIGQAGAPTEFQLTTDNNPQVNGLYQVTQDTVAASTNPVLATVAGGPVAGAATVIVQYVVTPEA